MPFVPFVTLSPRFLGLGIVLSHRAVRAAQPDIVGCIVVTFNMNIDLLTSNAPGRVERRRKSPYKAGVRTQCRPSVGVPLSPGRAPRLGCTRSAHLRFPPPEEGKGVVVSVAAHCAAHCAEVVGVAVGASCSWMTCSMQDRHLPRSKTSARSGRLERTWSRLGMGVRLGLGVRVRVGGWG